MNALRNAELIHILGTLKTFQEDLRNNPNNPAYNDAFRDEIYKELKTQIDGVEELLQNYDSTGPHSPSEEIDLLVNLMQLTTKARQETNNSATLPDSSYLQQLKSAMRSEKTERTRPYTDIVKAFTTPSQTATQAAEMINQQLGGGLNAYQTQELAEEINWELETKNPSYSTIQEKVREVSGQTSFSPDTLSALRSTINSALQPAEPEQAPAISTPATTSTSNTQNAAQEARTQRTTNQIISQADNFLRNITSGISENNQTASTLTFDNLGEGDYDQLQSATEAASKAVAELRRGTSETEKKKVFKKTFYDQLSIEVKDIWTQQDQSRVAQIVTPEPEGPLRADQVRSETKLAEAEERQKKLVQKVDTFIDNLAQAAITPPTQQKSTLTTPPTPQSAPSATTSPTAFALPTTFIEDTARPELAESIVKSSERVAARIQDEQEREKVLTTIRQIANNTTDGLSITVSLDTLKDKYAESLKNKISDENLIADLTSAGLEGLQQARTKYINDYQNQVLNAVNEKYNDLLADTRKETGARIDLRPPESTSPIQFAAARIGTKIMDALGVTSPSELAGGNQQTTSNQQEFERSVGAFKTEGDKEYSEIKTVTENIAKNTTQIPLNSNTDETIKIIADQTKQQLQQIPDSETRRKFIDDDGTLTPKGITAATNLANKATEAYLEVKESSFKKNTAYQAIEQAKEDLQQAINYRKAVNASESPTAIQQGLDLYANDPQAKVQLSAITQEVITEIIPTINTRSTTKEVQDLVEQKLIQKGLPAQDIETLTLVSGSVANAVLAKQEQYRTLPIDDLQTRNYQFEQAGFTNVSKPTQSEVETTIPGPRQASKTIKQLQNASLDTYLENAGEIIAGAADSFQQKNTQLSSKEKEEAQYRKEQYAQFKTAANSNTKPNDAEQILVKKYEQIRNQARDAEVKGDMQTALELSKQMEGVAKDFVLLQKDSLNNKYNDNLNQITRDMLRDGLQGKWGSRADAEAVRAYLVEQKEIEQKLQSDLAEQEKIQLREEKFAKQRAFAKQNEPLIERYYKREGKGEDSFEQFIDQHIEPMQVAPEASQSQRQTFNQMKKTLFDDALVAMPEKYESLLLRNEAAIGEIVQKVQRNEIPSDTGRALIHEMATSNEQINRQMKYDAVAWSLDSKINLNDKIDQTIEQSIGKTSKTSIDDPKLFGKPAAQISDEISTARNLSPNQKQILTRTLNEIMTKPLHEGETSADRIQNIENYLTKHFDDNTGRRASEIISHHHRQQENDLYIQTATQIIKQIQKQAPELDQSQIQQYHADIVKILSEDTRGNTTQQKTDAVKDYLSQNQSIQNNLQRGITSQITPKDTIVIDQSESRERRVLNITVDKTLSQINALATDGIHNQQDATNNFQTLFKEHLLGLGIIPPPDHQIRDLAYAIQGKSETQQKKIVDQFLDEKLDLKAKPLSQNEIKYFGNTKLLNNITGDLKQLEEWETNIVYNTKATPKSDQGNVLWASTGTIASSIASKLGQEYNIPISDQDGLTKKIQDILTATSGATLETRQKEINTYIIEKFGQSQTEFFKQNKPTVDNIYDYQTTVGRNLTQATEEIQAKLNKDLAITLGTALLNRDGINLQNARRELGKEIGIKALENLERTQELNNQKLGTNEAVNYAEHLALRRFSREFAKTAPGQQKVFKSSTQEDLQNATLEVARQIILQLKDVPPDQLQPEMRRIAKEVYLQQLGIHTGTLDQQTFNYLMANLDQILDKNLPALANSQRLRTALTLAKSSGGYIPLLEDESNLAIRTRLAKQVGESPEFYGVEQKSVGPLQNSRQVMEEYTRDEIATLLASALNGNLNFHKGGIISREKFLTLAQSKMIATSAIYEALGGLSLEKDLNGKEFWHERQAATGDVKSLGRVKLLQFDRWSEKDRTSFLKETFNELEFAKLASLKNLSTLSSKELDDYYKYIQRTRFLSEAAIAKIKKEHPDISSEVLAAVKTDLHGYLLNHPDSSIAKTVEDISQRAEFEKQPTAKDFATNSYLTRFRYTIRSWNNPNGLESMAKNTFTRVAYLPLTAIETLYPGTPPWRKHQGALWNSIVNPIFAERAYGIRFENFQLRYKVDQDERKALENLFRSSNFTLWVQGQHNDPALQALFERLKGKYSMREIRELQRLDSILTRAAQVRELSPKWLTKLWDSHAKLKQNDTYVLTTNILKSGDPLGTIMNYASNGALNHFLLSLRDKNGNQIFFFNTRSKAIEHLGWYRLRNKWAAEIAFTKLDIKQKIKNRIANSPLGRFINKIFIAPVKGILALAKQLVKQLVDKFPKLLLIATGVGAVISALWTAVGFIWKFVPREIKALFQYWLVVNLWKGVGWAIQPLVFLSNPFGYLGNAFGNWWGSSFASKVSGAFSFQTNFFVNPGMWAIKNLFGVWWNQGVLPMWSMTTTTISNMLGRLGLSGALSPLAGMLSWMVKDLALFTSTTTIVSLTIVTLWTYYNLTASLKDAPDTLGDATTEVEDFQTNPVTIIKYTDKGANERYTPGERVNYTITASFPGCGGSYVITDTLSPDLTLDPNSITYSFPNPPIESVTQNTAVSSGLRWEVNFNQDALNELCGTGGGGIPSDITNPQTTGIGGPFLNNPQYLSAYEVEQILRSRTGSPLQPLAGYWAQRIIRASERHGVNPALLLGVFYHEGGVGMSGPTRPAPQSDGSISIFQQGRDVTRDASRLDGGCRNLGNQRPGTISWRYGAYNVNNGQPACLFGGGLDIFAYYPTYEQSIDSVAANLASYMTRGIDTISEMSNTYSPAGDCGTNGVSCENARQMNETWRTDTSCTIRQKLLCQDTIFINDYGISGNVRGPNEPDPDIPGQAILSVTIKYSATINNPVASARGCITNTAVIRGNGPTDLSASTTALVPTTAEPCFTDDTPPNDPAQIIATLCSGIPAANGQTITICPTISTKSAPTAAGYTQWTLPQLKALWIVAHRVAKSANYATYAVGAEKGYKVEVQRSTCLYMYNESSWNTYCPSPDMKTTGYYANTGSGWQTLTGKTRLVLISDNASIFYKDQQAMYEWLFAHEIGHSAKWGNINGEVLGQDNNNAYKSYFNVCYEGAKEYVSAYGRPIGTTYAPPGKQPRPGNGSSENHADAISFYMTSGEAIEGYTYGSNPNAAQNRNIAIDYPCTYNSFRGNGQVPLSQSFFGGVEYAP